VILQERMYSLCRDTVSDFVGMIVRGVDPEGFRRMPSERWQKVQQENVVILTKNVNLVENR
jgi:hypothetical protein